MHREKRVELQFDNVARHFTFYFIANISNKYGMEYGGNVYGWSWIPFFSAYFFAVLILVYKISFLQIATF